MLVGLQNGDLTLREGESMQNQPNGDDTPWVEHQPGIGVFRSRQFTLSGGMRLVQSDYQPLAALAEVSRPGSSFPQLVLTFGLCGSSRFRADSGCEVLFNAGHLTVTSFQHSSGERLYRAGERVQQLRLVLNADSAQRYLGAETAEMLLHQPQLKRHLFSPFGGATAAQLNNVPTDPLLREIQALNLLALHRHQLQPQAVPQKKRHPQDLERVEQAHSWMLTHLAEPFTLATLALAVGLSDYQLKKGFQQHFGCTPGEKLLALRMQKAHQLLEEGYQVAQAAWQVGYQHPRNFSVAFQRYFGRPASQVAGRGQST
ncbi:MAG: AraC family transcriptional regulator [Pantoea sp.]|uniref:helix-turn-helix domain-containing protein n=1 Tax=Pantoea sp. TaxID=69393 RepID=UPI0039E6BB46